MAGNGRIMWQDREPVRSTYGAFLGMFKVPLELPEGHEDWTARERMEAADRILEAVSRMPSMGYAVTGIRGKDGRGSRACRWEVALQEVNLGTVQRAIILTGENPYVLVRPIPLD